MNFAYIEKNLEQDLSASGSWVDLSESGSENGEKSLCYDTQRHRDKYNRKYRV